ncbi:hypothetical protein QW060_25220 [Myroides ceti]|uniref:Uncharacterized protein n=1 Tax=Paenimyroides ceti TaxID=395087 RepID=A0ABT8D008_9FLAO|nr:hypothetical protein [Paenimyroides ceti]MDN3710178.1 hypothetical protein [Paenimyroides ceti]
MVLSINRQLISLKRCSNWCKRNYNILRKNVVPHLLKTKWISEGRRIRDERHGPTSWISITLKKKFRQIRKMTAAVGFPTLRLIRVRVGDFHLKD